MNNWALLARVVQEGWGLRVTEEHRWGPLALLLLSPSPSLLSTQASGPQTGKLSSSEVDLSSPWGLRKSPVAGHTTECVVQRFGVRPENLLFCWVPGNPSWGGHHPLRIAAKGFAGWLGEWRGFLFCSNSIYSEDSLQARRAGNSAGTSA